MGYAFDCMNFGKDVKKAFNALFHPSKETAVNFSLKRALTFYYKASVIPLVLTVLVGYAVMSLWSLPSTLPINYMSGMLGGSPLSLLIYTIVILWIMIPIGFFINAFIYQLVGKRLLKVFKQGYEKTFTAMVFGELPSVMLYWLNVVPLANLIFIIIVAVWSFIMQIIALSVQQKTTRLQALGVLLTTIVLAIIIAITVAFTAAYIFTRVLTNTTIV